MNPTTSNSPKVRMTNQIPPESPQRRAINYQLIENAKATSDDTDLQYKLQGDILLINNQQVKPPVCRLTAADILKVDEGSRSRVHKLPKGCSQQLFDRGSSFSAVVFKASKISEVRDIYQVQVGDSTHAAPPRNRSKCPTVRRSGANGRPKGRSGR